tara:strand:- start:1598 stop:2395 length:798 start_codon:yes stop_codon:yes gene_type:complete
MKNSFNNRLKEICELKNNRLCIGLDIDPKKSNIKITNSMSNLIDYTKDIIDVTIDLCPIYKMNLAFYECYGSRGYFWLEKVIEHIGNRALTIADGKRADIGNTAKKYAESIFNHFGFDCVTLSPYMGIDSIQPFILDPSKGAFILCLTSNKSALDIQMKVFDDEPLYLSVVKLCKKINVNNNIGIVVGATKYKKMLQIEKNSHGLNWLIPGIGAQGGDIKTSIEISNKSGVGIVNVSRGILYYGNCIKDVLKATEIYTEQIRKYL